MSQLSYIPVSEIRRVRESVKDPQALVPVLANMFRLNTLYMIAKGGSGHIGSSFSAMDIITWLWTQEMTNPNQIQADESDIYFSSKGHDAPGLYSLLIGLEKLEEKYVHQLRQLGGLPGHPDVHTPYMITNTGPLGMGISKARGMAIANRLNGKKGHFYVLTGDGELQEGQLWESLQPTANGKFSEITVIADHNKYQSDIQVSKVSDLGDLEAKFRAYGWEVARCDGHDPAAIAKALAHFKTVKDKPQILIADTIKGRGVSFMEHTAHKEDELYRYHSGAPSVPDYENGLKELTEKINKALEAQGVAPVKLESVDRPVRPAPQAPQKLVPAYGDELVKIARENKRIIALDGDLMLDTGLIPFKENFPDRFVECGIAEMDMVSAAGGMALKGMLPIVHSFACFLTTRPNEQIYNNATECTKIIYAGSLAGLLPSGPGHSHQSVRDIGAIGSMPGLTLVQPSNEAEARMSLRWAVDENPESTYIRLVTIPVDIPFELPTGYQMTKGQGVAVAEHGTDVAMIAYGPVMLSEAVKAANRLKEQGVGVTVYNLPWLNVIDEPWLLNTLAPFKTVVTVDDHYTQLGQGMQVAAVLAKAGVSGKKIVNLGVESIPVCGLNFEALAHHGLDELSLVQTILSHQAQALELSSR